MPKVHDLAYLLQLLETKFPSGGELLDSVMTLSEISTASRYPADLPEITAGDCLGFQDAAAIIVSWCRLQLDSLT
ncbi:MAG: hypothetical protein PSV13_21045 [Lacunisphaera sp.]|nr:hypothetical protein [Lacunisphaera sp.]